MPFQPALGVSDFRKLRESGAGYVHMTAFFAELLAETSEVLLLPRPRRFGKTLHLLVRCEVRGEERLPDGGSAVP
jgi:hypothetical protein